MGHQELYKPHCVRTPLFLTLDFLITASTITISDDESGQVHVKVGHFENVGFCLCFDVFTITEWVKMKETPVCAHEVGFM